MIRREFPSVEIADGEANLGKYLTLLNRTLFNFLVRIDPLNLEFSHRETLEKDNEKVAETYEKLNSWMEKAYEKMTLAQALSEPPEQLIPEYEHALEKLLQESVQSDGAISIVHQSDSSLKVGAKKSDSLSEISDHQLDRILSFIEKQNDSLSLSLIHVGLKDHQLHKICELLEEGKIMSLDLTGNQISNEGAHLLAKALSNESCLANQLTIDDNNIREEGAKSLITSIQNNAIFTLDMRRNNIPFDLFGELTADLKDDFLTASVKLE